MGFSVMQLLPTAEIIEKPSYQPTPILLNLQVSNRCRKDFKRMGCLDTFAFKLILYLKHLSFAALPITNPSFSGP
jgi:hypothetical protein